MNINTIKEDLIDFLKSMGVKKIIQLNDLNIKCFDDNFDVYYIEDSRTAGYIATGMSVEANETIFIVVGSDNDYRSLAPAITEAFYRNIPVLVGVFITNNYTLNFDNDFKDTFRKITVVNNKKMIGNLKEYVNDFPGLIVFDLDFGIQKDKTIDVYNNYLKIFNHDDFVLLSHNINYIPKIKAKVYINNGAGGSDGTISTLLGASLSSKYSKYGCLITETEMVHDINVLGNRNFPNNITIFVIQQDGVNKKSIKDFSEALNIDFSDYKDYKNNCDKSIIVWVEQV